MQKMVAQPPYRVLQRDEAAHIVWDAASRRWGCVFFVPQKDVSHAVAKETLPREMKVSWGGLSYQEKTAPSPGPT